MSTHQQAKPAGTPLLPCLSSHLAPAPRSRFYQTNSNFRQSLLVARSLPQLPVHDKYDAWHPLVSDTTAQSLQDYGIRNNKNYTCLGVLQLEQLSTPQALQQSWQQHLLPTCQETWSDLRQDINKLLQPDDDDCTHNQQDQCSNWAVGFLYKLDALLGELQQVLLLCGLLKDHHEQQHWRAAAAAVFVDARTMEQQACSDMLLQQGLVLANQTLQQQQQEEEEEEEKDEQAAVKQVHLSHALLLAKPLLKHMELEGLSPQGFAGITPLNPTGHQEPQVLSVEQQQSLLSGLQAEQRLLIKRMQDLLLNPSMAPVVHLDDESRHVLLAPLAAAGTTTAAAAATAAAVKTKERTAEDPAENSAVVLTLGLVQQLLEQHPSAAVRRDVYDAGLLQQLDRLLTPWAGLAEVRRKIARMQGYACYADMVLKHSLLGSWEAAAAFCEQLAVALQPAAAAAVQSMQQQQQKQRDGTEQAAVPPDMLSSNLAYWFHQAESALLSTADLLQLQPYLAFHEVLTGFDRLLQLSMGLSLTRRAAAAGEVWNSRVLAYDLHSVNQQQQVRSRNGSGGSGSSPQANQSQSLSDSTLLGTIYIDPSGGFSAQLLLYGLHYSGLRPNQQQQQQKSPMSPTITTTSSSCSNGSSCTSCAAPAVAVGLQSGGVLCGTSQRELALGLWELCHELGHAVNFILSAAQTTPDEQQPQYDRQDQGQHQQLHPPQQRRQRQAYHLHAAWLPLELLELPSTLFEAFCMDAKCLQLLCRHSTTGDSLPALLADKLARYMRHRHQNALLQQQTVQAMLVDVQLASVSSKLVGSHSAHMRWQATVMSDMLAATPSVEVSLHQVATLPRLLLSAGQGYGYAVAWSLAQLLQPALLLHVHESLDQECNPDGNAAVSGKQLWHQFLGQGMSMIDVRQLVLWIVRLQGQPRTVTQEANAGPVITFETDACTTAADAAVGRGQWLHSQLSAMCLLRALQEQGMWHADKAEMHCEIHRERKGCDRQNVPSVLVMDSSSSAEVLLSADPMDLLAVCLSTVLSALYLPVTPVDTT